MASIFTYPQTTVLSKIQIGSELYYVKDADARAALDLLGTASKANVSENGVAEGETGLVTGAQVQNAIKALSGVLHLKGVIDALPANTTDYEDGDVVIVGTKEYVVYNGAFKEFGDEGLYVPNTQKIATIALDHDITVAELQTALDLKALAYKDSASGTVAGQTIAGVKATGTTTGSIAVELDQTATAATLTTSAYKPEGSIEGTTTAAGSVSIAKDADNGTQISGSVSAPTVTVTPATASVQYIDSLGSQASFSEGKFSAGSLPTYKQGAKAAWSASVSDETLSFSFTANGDDTFSQGTLPSKDADTFTANELPTKTAATTVVTGITKAEASAPVFTGDKFAASFKGASSDITATFNGTEKANAIVTGVSYDKASVNAEGTKFTGAAVELAVGDITVAAKDVTVS